MTYINNSPLSYPTNAARGIRQYLLDRNPSSEDFRQFILGDEWLNLTGMTWWKLADKTSTSGTWIQMGGSSIQSLEIIPDSGTSPVSPNVSNQLHINGTSGIQVVGASADTLQIQLTSPTALTFDANSGSAVPSANVINILGSGGALTSASGNTVTVTAGSSVATSYVEDSGSAVPSANVLHIVGGSGIATSGAGNTVTIAATGGTPTTFTADTGSATQSGNNLNVLGGTGIHTTGSGATLTIASAGTVATTYDADTGSATPSGNIITFAGTTSEIATSATGATVTTRIANDAILPGTGAFTFVTGSTAQQPGGVNGMARYDSTLNKFRAYEGGTWKNMITSPGGGGGWTFLGSQTASSSASLIFGSSIISSTFPNYAFVISMITMSASSASLYCQFSTNGGSTWVNTGYFYPSNGNAAQISLGGSPVSATTLSGTVFWHGPSQGAIAQMGGTVTFTLPSAAWSNGAAISGYNTNNQVYNAIQFFASLGNLASGTIYCYGIQNT